MENLKLLISWSQPSSKQLALVLKRLLPCVIQRLDPWMSDADIGKGNVWSDELLKSLKDAQGTIICVTPDNLQSQWLHFEAGVALGNVSTLDKTRVCPYVHGVSKTDVTGPLSIFQMATSSRDETFELIQTINGWLDDYKLDDHRLQKSFDAVWDEWDEAITSIEFHTSEAEVKRSEESMTAEILDTVRDVKRNQERVKTIRLGPRNPIIQPVGGDQTFGDLLRHKVITEKPTFKRILGSCGSCGESIESGHSIGCPEAPEPVVDS